ncbi:AbrB/MazE/SpoVT family DNA-binding domain-containing protein [Candidatus Kaiserbacteria bacterium]|nr:AbrB/MazE/SpoVT family DNA-binding domain-containing protein [Candidatus Kaiserbacteria bacterium]
MSTTIKVQERGVITLPKRLRDKVGITPGAMFDVEEHGGTIVMKPVSHIAPEILQDLKSALEDLRAGNFITFSTIEEFHKKRQAKWGKK